MAQDGVAGSGDDDDTVPQAGIEAVLEAVDGAFRAVLHARYAGGVHCAFLRGTRVTEQILRAAPPDAPARLLLEFFLRAGGPGGAASSPAGFGRVLHDLATVIGTVSIAPGPGGRAVSVRVVTELVDDADAGGRTDSSTAGGVMLAEASPGLPGASGGGPVHVVRSGAAGAERDRQERSAARGWHPTGGRVRPNRAGGLGSNGHRRAGTAGLPVPVAGLLLQGLGDRLAEAEGIGPLLQRVVVGLDLGDAR